MYLWLSLFSSPYTVQLGFGYSSTGSFYFSSVAVMSGMYVISSLLRGEMYEFKYLDYTH